MKLRAKEITTDIPTVSMLDIAFLLIIFFVVTAVFSITKGLEVRLAKDGKNLPLLQKEAVYIKVNPDTSISIDGRPIELDAVLSCLQLKLERWPEIPIILHTDPEAPYYAMVAVYDVLSQAENRIGIKIKSISIPTSREIQAYIDLYPAPDEPEPIRGFEPEPVLEPFASTEEFMVGNPEPPPQERPFMVGEDGITEPVLIPESKVDPTYPKAARKAKIVGSVILRAVIRKDGTMGGIVVLRAPGANLGFEEAAMEAVKKWRYKPATKSGEPVDVYFTVEIIFAP